MKRHLLVLTLALFAVSAIAADGVPPGHPKIDAKAAGSGQATLPQKGKVLSVVDVPQYTYLEVRQQSRTFWIAGPTVAAKKGDVVRFGNGMVMRNFHSKSLNRDFQNISFVSRVVVTKEKE